MKLTANAKINLTLDICGKRDDGYHLLDSVMQSISLCDCVLVERAKDITVGCSDGELGGVGNIAFVAAKAFFDATGISGGADIYIEKHIPKAAGLGGGSADAAAVIAALDRIYETNLPCDRLCEIALTVGADVPFCLVGGTKRVTGIGENLADAPYMPECGILLIKAGNKGSTGEMYRMLDMQAQREGSTQAMLAALESGSALEVAGALDNAFLSVCDIGEVRLLLEKTWPLGISLSGSGPTVFAIYPDHKAAVTAGAALEVCGYEVYSAEPKTSGIIFE